MLPLGERGHRRCYRANSCVARPGYTGSAEDLDAEAFCRYSQYFTEAKRATAHGEPVLGQCVVADFLSEGHFGRHLKRMRGLYAARRDALAAALRSTFGNRLELTLRPGGMHLLARFPGQGNDVELARRAFRHGLLPAALSAQYLGRTRDSGLMLSFTNIAEEQALPRARALARALGTSSR